MSQVIIDSAVIERLERKVDMLTAMLQQNNAQHGLSKYMTEEEVIIATGLKTKTLYQYRQYGVFNAQSLTGRKPKYLRKEVNDFLDGKLAHKVWEMREAIKEAKKKPHTAAEKDLLIQQQLS